MHTACSLEPKLYIQEFEVLCQFMFVALAADFAINKMPYNMIYCTNTRDTLFCLLLCNYKDV